MWVIYRYMYITSYRWRWLVAGLVLGHCLQHWPNIQPTPDRYWLYIYLHLYIFFAQYVNLPWNEINIIEVKYLNLGILKSFMAATSQLNIQFKLH